MDKVFDFKENEHIIVKITKITVLVVVIIVLILLVVGLGYLFIGVVLPTNCERFSQLYKTPTTTAADVRYGHNAYGTSPYDHNGNPRKIFGFDQERLKTEFSKHDEVGMLHDDYSLINASRSLDNRINNETNCRGSCITKMIGGGGNKGKFGADRMRSMLNN